MIKQLHGIAVFVAVADTGAFNKAADRLGLSTSVVSHHISRLEQQLGTTLIYRSTRKLALSEQGRTLYETARQLLDGTEDVLHQITASNTQPAGTLRVTMPAFMPDPAVEIAIMNFVRRYPDIDVSLAYEDKRANLPNDDLDLAIRVGQPSDSMLHTQRLTSIRHVLVATPDLVQQYGPLSHPNDLTNLPFINHESAPNFVTLINNSSTHHLEPDHISLRVNSIHAAQLAAETGIGLADLPITVCAEALKAGRLVHVLPDWEIPEFPVVALWSGKARRNSLIKLMLTHITSQGEPDIQKQNTRP